MHDPNQDRVKVPRVIYFRLKRTQLGDRYKQFLRENLAPSATIFLLECQYTWLATRVGDRHLFQFGGAGLLSSEDYFDHSQQIADFLQQHNSTHSYWNPPAPDGRFSESEWGFDPALRTDVEQFADQHGFCVRRIVGYYQSHLFIFNLSGHYAWDSYPSGQSLMTSNRPMV